MFSNISQISQEKAVLKSFLIKLAAWEPETLLKRHSDTGLLQNFQNTYFEEHLGMAASKCLAAFVTYLNQGHFC